MTDPVGPEMTALIQAKLREIAAEAEVHILFAVESGSRAWGFHSPDSDYDVRFVYARPPRWHYRLGKKRDVLEVPINDALDISGWELCKALELTLGSNAVIAEWLQSPIVYQSDPAAMEALTGFAQRALDRKSVTWHYFSLAQRQVDRMQAPGGAVRLKRFFYVLRPILALRWMRLHDAAMPPMNMRALCAACELEPEQQTALDHLTAQKQQAKERAEAVLPDRVLQDLVDFEMTQARDWLSKAPRATTGQLWEEAHALHWRLSPR